MFYSAEILRTSSPGDSISSSPERTAQRKQEDEPEILQQRAGSLNIKRLLLIENRHPKLRNLAFSYVLEDAMVWAH